MKNNKGFSLVELIIVIAIMVALVAVLAPSYLKYVKKSKDAVVTQAAEDAFAFTKAQYAEQELTGNGIIRIASDGNDLLYVRFLPNDDNESLSYAGLTGEEAQAEFVRGCGLRSSTSNSTVAYEIEIKGESIQQYSIDMETLHDGNRDI